MKALLDVLEKKAVLSGQDVQAVIDATLTALEHRPQDNAIDIARWLIEGAVITRSAARREGSADQPGRAVGPPGAGPSTQTSLTLANAETQIKKRRGLPAIICSCFVLDKSEQMGHKTTIHNQRPRQ